MTRTIKLAIVLMLLSMSVAAQHDWKGSYSFDENGGKNAGGIAILISHQLDVYEGEGGLMVSLESQGYQTSSDLMCTAKVQGSKLLIYFQSYGENNTFERYEPGDLLLTLEAKPSAKGSPTILTYWGKFTPSIPKNEKTGKVYFRKEH